MARSLVIAPFAQEGIRELPRDSVLLASVFRRLEEAADDPERFTEPGVYPVPVDRRMMNFAASDLAGRPWHFTVVVAVTDATLEVRVIRGAQYALPPGSDDE